MHSLAVRQQYNSQISPVHFCNRSPTADSAISLNHLFHGLFHDALNPFQSNLRAIWAMPHRFEVSREPHGSTVIPD